MHQKKIHRNPTDEASAMLVMHFSKKFQVDFANSVTIRPENEKLSTSVYYLKKQWKIIEQLFKNLSSKVHLQVLITYLISYMDTISWPNKCCDAHLCEKKLYYGRGITQRSCQYRKKLAINEWPWHTPKVITVAAIKWPYGK